MQKTKKIKKQKKGDSVWESSNYSKLSQLYTKEIVQGLLLQLLKLPSKLQNLVNCTDKAASAKFLFLFCDEIDGDQLEDLLRKFDCEKVKKLMPGDRVIRCKNKGTKNLAKENIWDDFLDIPVVGEQLSESGGPEGPKEAASTELAKKTKELKAKIFEESGAVPESPGEEDPELLELFRETLLTSAELEKHMYPYNQPDYVDSRSFKETPGPKYQVLGVDCEMVQSAERMELAQIVLIDSDFRVLFSKFVKPEAEITDYLTAFSGITPETFTQNPHCSLAEIQADLARFMDSDTILVGHGLENDLHALKMIHRRCLDTSVLFKRQTNYRMSLKNIAYELFGIKIQQGAHDPAEDARVAMALARLKVEALDKYLPVINCQLNYSVEMLNRLHGAFGVQLVDFEFNVKRLLQSEAQYEAVLRPDDVFKLTLKVLKQTSEETNANRIVFARFLLNKNHDFDKKCASFKAFLGEIADLQAEKALGFCLATAGYRKDKPEGVFGYDLLIFG